MYCMHCGEQIPDNSRFCRYCGKLVAEDEIRTVNAETDEKENEETVSENIQAEGSAEEVNITDENGVPAEEESSSSDSIVNKESGESSVESILNAAREKTEKEPDVEIVDDYLFEHISGGKKAALFIGAVFITAIVAVIVFACFFPELI